MTAQRGGELSKLRWSDVEGDWFTIPSTATKNKQPHRVPLTEAAKQIVDALPKIVDCEYLFPSPSGKSACGDHKKAGQRIAARVLATLQEADETITSFDFRGHDLRRTASTRMAEAGIPQAAIAKVLNVDAAAQVEGSHQHEQQAVAH
jgi:integrase